MSARLTSEETDPDDPLTLEPASAVIAGRFAAEGVTDSDEEGGSEEGSEDEQTVYSQSLYGFDMGEGLSTVCRDAASVVGSQACTDDQNPMEVRL